MGGCSLAYVALIFGYLAKETIKNSEMSLG
jgi:hypothetical protein